MVPEYFAAYLFRSCLAAYVAGAVAAFVLTRFPGAERSAFP